MNFEFVDLLKANAKLLANLIRCLKDKGEICIQDTSSSCKLRAESRLQSRQTYKTRRLDDEMGWENKWIFFEYSE